MESKELRKLSRRLKARLNDSLQEIIEEEENKLNPFNSRSFSPLTGKFEFFLFLRSKRFRKFYEESKRHVPPNEDDEYLLRYFGRLFEDMVYSSLVLNKRPDLLLSPEATLRFYRKLYSHLKFIKNSFQSSIDSITVPDGLLLDLSKKPPQITKVLEYTLVTGGILEDKLYGKLKGYWWDKRNFEALFKGSKFSLVIPMGSGLDEKFYHNPDIEIEELPFNKERFLEVARQVSDYVPPPYQN